MRPPLALLPVAALIVAGCGDATNGTQPSAPSHLELMSAARQSGYVGTTLAEPLVVRVVDADSQGVAGQRITWTVSDRGGTITPEQTTTGADGTASASWTLGLQSGSFVASAKAAGMDSVMFDAVSLADTVAPHMVDFAIAPSEVDVTQSDGVITFTAHLTDEGSGVRQAQLAIQATTGNPANLQWAECLNMTRNSGSPADGSWSCSITVPKSSTAGVWKVIRVSMWDAASNTVSLGDTDLTAAGQPTDITVVDASADATPPALTAFAITPDTIDVSTGAKQVTFSASVEDAGSGLSIGMAFLRAPGASSANGCRLQLVSGTASSGAYMCSMLVSDTSVAGQWGAEVSLEDVTRNYREYTSAQLETAGFESSAIVHR